MEQRSTGQFRDVLHNICSELLWGVVVAVFLLLMHSASYALPDEQIQTHINEASGILSYEGVYPSYYFYNDDTVIDNFTDAIILNVAYSKDRRISYLDNSLANTFYDDGNVNPVSSLRTMTGSDIDPNARYTRYWFGTSGLVRFLFLFLPFLKVRALFTALVVFSAAAAVILLSETAGKRYAFILAVSLHFTRIWHVAFSLQYAPAIIIACLGVCAVCLSEKNNCFRGTIPYVFLTIGILTAYYDLLTCPLLTFGLPAAAAMLIDLKKTDASGDSVKAENPLFFPAKCGLIWMIGYAAMFLFKWILASVILHDDIFSTVKEKFLMHSDSTGKYSIKDVFLRNTGNYFTREVIVLLLLFTAGYLIRRLVIRKRSMKELFAPRRLVFLLVACIPFVWYSILKSHSFVHSWMTYRLLAVTLFSYLSWLVYERGIPEGSGKD